MANGNPEFNDRQKLILDDLNELYANRFESSVVPTATEGDDRPPLSSYSPTIQNIFGGEGFKKVYSETEEQAMRKMLADNDIDADSFFKNDPEATPVDVMRATNYQNFATREDRYNKEGTFSNEEAKIQGLEDLNKKYNSMFEGNMVYPKLGARVADLVPSFVMDDDVRRADFEQAIRNEYGLKFDLDSSEMIGDVYSEGRPVLNELRKLRYRASDVGAGLTSNAMDVMSGLAALTRGVDSYFGGDELSTQAEINEDYQQRKESGEAQTKNEAGNSFLSSFNLDDGLFWDALYSTDARNDWYESHTRANTVDFQQISDGADSDYSQLWRATTDQFVQSAPLIADIIAGNAIAKGALKGATKAVSRKAAGKYATRTGGRYASQSTGKFMSKEAVMKINEKAAKINHIINRTGGFFAADALISAGIHADNVGQEWYDSLTPQQRFAYLASESSAETLSAIVLEGVVIKGFGRAKKALGQGGFRGQKKFIKELGKAVAESVLIGASAEAAAEAGTAAWQYWNEIQAKKATDPNAVGWEQEVFEDRVLDGLKAGAALGAVGGLFGGLTGGAASAYVSTRHPLSVEANKEVKKAAQEMVNAANSEAKRAAAERFEKVVQKHSGAKTSLTRAYYRLSQQNPEAFTKITELQREINLTVRRFKKSEDPEQQEAQKRELERLVQEKQQVENDIAKESGAETFDDMISEEVENLGVEREEKLNSFKEKKRNSPEAEADRLAEIAELQELEEQRTSLEAAQAVNSPDQNTDDDAQDQQGETQEDSDMQRDEDAPIEGVEGNAENLMSPTALEGQPLADKYRDIVGRVNNLLRAFKPLGINAVVHTTEQSYFNATGKKAGKGAFKDGKTIHINLSNKNVRASTVRHEFLHAAFLTVSPQQKLAFYEELRSIYIRIGGADASTKFAEGIKKIEEAYKDKGYSPEQMLEEKIVTVLEQILDSLPTKNKQGIIAKIWRAIKKYIPGAKDLKESEEGLMGFVDAFRAAEQEGTEFRGSRVDKAVPGVVESVDSGMNRGGFKSTAYPDLIRKKVTYAKTFINKMGREYQLFDEVFVNDYWHFRNWWIKETGNGKRGNYLSNFTYVGENGKNKKINPPRPKVDKSTGEVIDMEPKLQTPFEMKFAANQRAAARRDVSANRDSATESLAGSILEVVGLSKTGGREESRTELFINSRGSETESKSDLPVVFSDTIFTEGLRNMQFQNEYGDAVRSTMEDFAFLVPKDQAGEFAYSIRNNGDGSVTIDAHSDQEVDNAPQQDEVSSANIPDDADLLEQIDGVSEMFEFDSEPYAGSKLAKISLSKMAGKLISVVGYDGTNYEGESGVYQDTPLGYLLSFSTKRKAKEGLDEIRQRAIDDYNKRKKGGDTSLKGTTLIAPVVMGEGSMLSNKRVCKDIIKILEESELTDNEVIDVFNNLLLDQSKQTNLKALLSAADMTLDSGRAPDGFKNVTIGKKVGSVDNTYTIPVTKKAFIETLKKVNNVRSMTTRNNIFSFITGTSFGSKSVNQLSSIRSIKNSELAQKGLVGTIPLIKEYLYELEMVGERLELVGVDIDSPESRKDLSFPFGLKVKEGSIKQFEPEKKLNWMNLMSSLKRKGKKDTIGEEFSKTTSAFDRAKAAVKNARISDASRKKVEEFYESVLKNRKDKTFSERDAATIINSESLNKSEQDYLNRLAKRDLAKKTRDSVKTAVKSSERTLLGAQIDNELDINFTAESVDLDVDFNTSTGMPFNPNNMNSFQAFMLRMDQLFANKYANVMRMQKAIESAKGKVVDLSKDFINAEALLYGKTANDLDKLDGKVKDISLEMKDKGLNSEDVSEYLIARHAKERNAVISERTEGKDEAGSGMTNERADEIMNSLSPEKKAALDSVAAKVDAITADTRKTMVDFGLEEKSTIDAFEAMFQNYVPLGGLALDEQNSDTSLYPTGGAGMSVYGDTTKRARGRKSEAQNVLAQAIAQNAAVHAKARKNEALSSLYKLVKDNPNPKVWRLAKEVPFDAQSAVGVRVNGEQQFIVFSNPDMAKSLKNMGVEKLDLFSKAMRRFSGFLRRSFTTANPEFIISNFARDIQSALFNAMAEADIPGGQIPGRHIAAKVMTRVKQTLPALLKNAVGKDLPSEMAAYFEEFKEDGGQTGWGFVKDVGTIAAEIESEINEKSKAKKASEWMAKNSIDVIENVNDAFENSVRLAAYIEARKAGVSREKAAELSKNITVNFNRSGELGPMANAWYMFFNASVQGTVRLARSLGTLKDVRKPNGELDSWFNRLNGAQKMAFGLSLTTGMLTMINIAMSDDDEDGVSFYEKIPDYEKERNLIIMYSGKNYFKIPLPYGFNVFANMGTSMVEAANGQREPLDAGMFLLNSAFSSFSPISFGQSKDASKYLAKGLSPTILKPFVDIAVNETYFGSSVYRQQFPVGAPKPQAEMSYRSPEGVRSFFQWMNEATGGSEQVPGSADFNPDKFWYGFEYYIGGAGQFITRSLGTGKDLFETIKEGEKVPMKANDFPFLRKLYGEASKYYDSDTYTDNANLVSQLYKERKEAEDKNDKRYKGVMKLESARKSTEKKIKRLRKLRKEARDIENYVERQNRIYDLYEKERSLLMQFNKQYEQIRGKD